jgi:hypothetical protein
MNIITGWSLLRVLTFAVVSLIGGSTPVICELLVLKERQTAALGYGSIVYTALLVAAVYAWKQNRFRAPNRGKLISPTTK